jgi:hypothetical protein
LDFLRLSCAVERLVDTAVLACSMMLIVVVLACEPTIESVTWEAIDYPENLERFQHPAGTLIVEDQVALAVEEQLNIWHHGEFLDDYELLYRQLTRTLDYLAESSSGSDAYAPAKSGVVLHGSETFVRYSCVGPDAEHPAVDFEHGALYLEGPVFALEEVLETGAPVLHGHVLGRFEGCTIGDVQVSGVCPGYLDDLRDRIALELNIYIERSGLGAGFRQRKVFLSDDAIWVLIETPKGDYSLGIVPSLKRAAFALSTKDGDFQCHAEQSGSWTCTIPVESQVLQTRLKELMNWTI